MSLIQRTLPAALAAAALVALPGTATAAPGSMLPEPLPPVPSLDVERYGGTWQQIAAIPQPFSLQCARDTRAEYGIIGPGEISVRNTCTTWTGEQSQIDGTARVTDSATNAALRVRFPTVPFEIAEEIPNYVVTYVDDEYSVAIVGDPARTSGFVLSRTSSISTEQWQLVRSTIESRGWDSCFFLTSPTTGGLEEIRPLCTL
ncbi:apolipoprotein D and lipocalin family protein [Hoyosella altamirensis]|uniref:Apolipoprotein D and lipocalin family protein n=2 Tax=Hoyosella altamirensis TaxID=616997 RepID=A0A839RIR6_9ACTN|nr:apolipoprotein D and lipocalin family protein [Hoyosella altamirensis]